MDESPNDSHLTRTLDTVSRDVRLLVDVTARVDERLKNLDQRMTDQDRRISILVDHMNTITNRVVVLESKGDLELRKDLEDARARLSSHDQRISLVEYQQTGTGEKWKSVVTFAFQLITAVTTAYLIFRLGISGSP